MWCKAVHALLPVAAACLFVLSSATSGRAGGFGIGVEVPSASLTGVSPADAVLLLTAAGCHGPGAMVAGKAEGIVDGKRVTIPLRLEPLGNDRYAVKRQWPEGTGAWVISLSAKSQHAFLRGKERVRPVVNVLVEIDADGRIAIGNRITDPSSGKVREFARVKYVGSGEKALAVEQALRRLSASASVVSRG